MLPQALGRWAPGPVSVVLGGQCTEYGPKEAAPVFGGVGTACPPGTSVPPLWASLGAQQHGLAVTGSSEDRGFAPGPAAHEQLYPRSPGWPVPGLPGGQLTSCLLLPSRGAGWAGREPAVHPIGAGPPWPCHSLSGGGSGLAVLLASPGTCSLPAPAVGMRDHCATDAWCPRSSGSRAGPWS